MEGMRPTGMMPATGAGVCQMSRSTQRLRTSLPTIPIPAFVLPHTPQAAPALPALQIRLQQSSAAMPSTPQQKRQGYGGVTSGIAQVGNNASQAASHATSSLSRPQIVGVVVAILAVLALVVGLTWWACVRSAKRRDAAKEEELQRARQRLGADMSSTHVDMQHIAFAGEGNPRLTERRGSERTLDEDWSREPLREADSRALHYQGGQGYTHEYGTAIGQPHDAFHSSSPHQYAATPTQPPYYAH